MQETAEMQSAFVDECLPLVEREAKRRFGWIRCEAQRCDLIAEAVALAWMRWKRETENGADPYEKADRITRGAVMKARRGGSACGGHPTTEALSWHAVKAGYLPHVSLSQCEPGSDREAYTVDLNDRRGAQPWQLAVVSIDWAEWLTTLSDHERAILTGLGAGLRHLDVARQLGVVRSVVSYHASRLRERWLAYSSAPDPVQDDDGDNGADTRVDAEPERPVSHA